MLLYCKLLTIPGKSKKKLTRYIFNFKMGLEIGMSPENQQQRKILLHAKKCAPIDLLFTKRLIETDHV